MAKNKADELFRKSIRNSIELLVERAKARLLGRFYQGPRIVFQIIKDFGLENSLEGVYRHTTAHTLDLTTQPSEDVIEAQADTVDSVMEAFKNRVFTDVMDAVKSGSEKRVKEIFEKATDHMEVIAAEESRKAQSLSKDDAIAKIAAASGIEDPTVFWIGRLDDKTCFEEESNILTKTGLVKAGNLSVGDLLCKPVWVKSINPNKDSNVDQYFARINHIEKKRQEVFEFEFDNGKKVKCTSDHPVLARVGRTYLFWEIGYIPDNENIEIVDLDSISGKTLKIANYQIALTKSPLSNLYDDIWDFTQKNRNLISSMYLSNYTVDDICKILGQKHSCYLGSKFRSKIKAILLLAGIWNPNRHKIGNNFNKSHLHRVSQKRADMIARISKEALNLYQSGCSVREIGKILKSPYQVVAQSLRCSGVDLHRESLKRKCNGGYATWKKIKSDPTLFEAVRARSRRVMMRQVHQGSKPQQQLRDLLIQNNHNVLYNHSINDRIRVDMLVDGKIVVEFDGSGHNMQVRFGKITPKQLKARDYSRDRYCKQIGYKIVRIVSPMDMVPSYDTICAAFRELENSGKTFVEVVIS